MKLTNSVVGAIAGQLLGQAAMAQTADMRPTSRAEVMIAKLASARPDARPPYMLRYPVQLETGVPDVRPAPRS